MPDIELLAGDLDGATVTLPAPAALFVRTGRAIGRRAGQVGPGDGAYAPSGTVVTADVGSIVWVWLVGRSLSADLDGLRILRRERVPFEHHRCLLRFDRVDSPPGGETPRHTHAGPGLRRLVAGRIEAEIGRDRFEIMPDEVWFERGPDPVIGRSVGDVPASFVRLLVLPPDMRGRPSYRAWDSTETAKPSPVGYRLVFETDIEPWA